MEGAAAADPGPFAALATVTESQPAAAAAPRRNNKACRVCGSSVRVDGRPRMLRCTRCLSAWWCSVEHQKLDWPVHRGVCIAPTSSKPSPLDAATTLPPAAAPQPTSSPPPSLVSEATSSPQPQDIRDIVSLVVAANVVLSGPKGAAFAWAISSLAFALREAAAATDAGADGLPTRALLAAVTQAHAEMAATRRALVAFGVRGPCVYCWHDNAVFSSEPCAHPTFCGACAARGLGGPPGATDCPLCFAPSTSGDFAVVTEDPLCARVRSAALPPHVMEALERTPLLGWADLRDIARALLSCCQLSLKKELGAAITPSEAVITAPTAQRREFIQSVASSPGPITAAFRGEDLVVAAAPTASVTGAARRAAKRQAASVVAAASLATSAHPAVVPNPTDPAGAAPIVDPMESLAASHRLVAETASQVRLRLDAEAKALTDLVDLGLRLVSISYVTSFFVKAQAARRVATSLHVEARYRVATTFARKSAAAAAAIAEGDVLDNESLARHVQSCVMSAMTDTARLVAALSGPSVGAMTSTHVNVDAAVASARAAVSAHAAASPQDKAAAKAVMEAALADLVTAKQHQRAAASSTADVGASSPAPPVAVASNDSFTLANFDTTRASVFDALRVTQFANAARIASAVATKFGHDDVVTPGART